MLKGVGDLVTADPVKVGVLNAVFASAFRSKGFQASVLGERDQEGIKLPAVDEGQVRNYF